MTFSIVAFDPVTGDLGSAAASCSVAVGGTVTYSRLGVGIVNTQHRAHLHLGNEVLDHMERGLSPAAAMRRVLGGDQELDERQLLAIDTQCRRGGWTGRSCRREHALLHGETCVGAGNTLAAGDAITRMVEAFEDAHDQRLGERLLLALEAAEAAGGDRRGRQSAAVYVLPPRMVETDVNLDLRVDEHADPLRELRRIYGVFLRRFQSKPGG